MGFVMPTLKVATMAFRIIATKASYQSCREQQKRVLTKMGLDPSLFGMHSPRLSGNVVLKDAGFQPGEVGVRVGWALHSTMALHYAKQARKKDLLMDDALAL
jgi:hypothetical protein